MKRNLKRVLLVICCCSTTMLSFSQQTTENPVITKITKFKPPVVKSVLGINSNGATVTIDEANQLIALPLKITDAQENAYKIDSYHFLYKKKGVVEDEQTGRKQMTFTTVSSLFDSTPLPKVWQENIQNGFQKDEEMYFFDIVVKDNSGRKFFAPDLKIRIQ
ncbi:MAG: hypothetical protein ABIO82_01865 [Ginsengibacter sp.]